MPDNTTNLQEQSELHIFSELYRFARESTGIAITLAYLILILTSMSYLIVFYGKFNISIIKLVTLEDILVTPIKNPDIILVYVGITFLFYLVDISYRLKNRLQLKYLNKKKPFYVRLVTIVAWAPKSRKTNIRLSVFMAIFSLAAYVYFFASVEGVQIQNGEGHKVQLVLNDAEAPVEMTLLGNTSQFVMVFDAGQKQAYVYQLEAINHLKPPAISKPNRASLALKPGNDSE
jgi:hypothetical protein